MRIAVTGGPKTGKTQYADTLSNEVIHTDDYITPDWSKSSETIAEFFNQPGSMVIEGTTIPRALRKWLKANPSGRPVDLLVYFQREPFSPLTERQKAMTRGIDTVFREIKTELENRGVRITYSEPTL